MIVDGIKKFYSGAPSTALTVYSREERKAWDAGVRRACSLSEMKVCDKAFKFQQ